MQQECLIALPTPLLAASHVRSTLIQSSLNTLRTRGLFDRYLGQVKPQYKDRLLGCLGPEWVELEAGMAHYAACDALALSEADLIQIGEDVGGRIQGTFLGTLAVKARLVGLTPWHLLAQFERLYGRLMQGGGIGVYKAGPKDALIEVRLLPLASHAYFRTAFCGVVAAGIKLGAGRSVRVKVEGASGYGNRLVMRASWV